ncbi:hypothetical protein FIU82_04440 [Pseudoalteromonas sp. THAF3]|nr:hypothetical protein FIU82_04440 [Pseudoalteromonas sp. THAF3]
MTHRLSNTLIIQANIVRVTLLDTSIFVLFVCYELIFAAILGLLVG